MELRESAFALDKTLRSAQAVVRRRFVSDFLRLLGTCLCLASIAALILVFIAKWWRPDLLAWWPFAALGFLAVCAAAFRSYRSLWTRERAARELDRSLKLHDTLSSALELRQAPRPEEAPFIRELTLRAEAAAAKADPSRSLRIAFGPAWTAWPLVTLLAVAAAWFLPERSQLAAAQAKKRADETRETASELRTLAQAITPRKPESQTDRIAAPEADEAISALERELTEGKITPHEARVRAAEELNKKSAELEKKAQAEQRAIDDARSALAKAAARSNSERNPNPQAARIAEALRKGDIDAAADEIEKLAKNEQILSAADRTAAAKEIERIAEALDPQAAKAEQSESSSPAESIRDAARKAAQNLHQNTQEPKSLDPAQQTSPPAKPQPRSESAAAKNDQQSNKDAADRQNQPPGQPPSDSEKKPENTAKPNSGPQDQPRQPGQQKPQNDAGKQSKQPDQRSDPNQADQPSQPRTQESKPQSNPTEKQNEKPTQKQDEKRSEGQNEKKEQAASEKSKEPGAAPEAPQKTPAQSPTPQQGEGQQPPPSDNSKAQTKDEKPDQRVTENSQTPQQNPQGTPRPQQPGTQPQSPPPTQGQNQQAEQKSDPKGEQQPNPQQPGSQPSPGQQQPNQQSGQQLGQQPDQQPSQSNPPAQQPQPGSQQNTRNTSQPQREERPGTGSPTGENLDQLAKELRNISRQNSNAKRNQETARGLRDRAEQMMESASPEDRARMEQLARQLARSDVNPAKDAYPEWHGPTQTFDTRPDETAPQSPDSPPDRTIAEWLSEPKPGGKGPAGVLPVDPLRKATEGAQQAIEQQAIPPRYTDLVKRVFKRYSDTKPTPTGAPK